MLLCMFHSKNLKLIDFEKHYDHVPALLPFRTQASPSFTKSGLHWHFVSWQVVPNGQSPSVLHAVFMEAKKLIDLFLAQVLLQLQLQVETRKQTYN